MLEPASSPCFASHTANLTFELSSTTPLNTTMLFSNQDKVNNKQSSTSQNKGTDNKPEKVIPLNIIPPSSQIISSVSTSASSSASSSSKATQNVQPSTKKYKVKINSGKGTIPGDFFNQYKEYEQAGRAMTAAAKERQFTKIDSMHTMSYIAETTESAEATFEDPSIELKKPSTHLKSNVSKLTKNNSNNTNNSSASKTKPSNGQIVYSKLSASKKENVGGGIPNGDGSQFQKNQISRAPIGQKICSPVLNQNDANLFHKEDVTGPSTTATSALFSASQIFSIQDTPKFSSVPEGQDSQFFPISNLNPHSLNGMTNNNSVQLRNLNLECKESLSSLKQLDQNTTDISASSSSNFYNQSHTAPCISQGQSEIHMSFCDGPLLDNNNNNLTQPLNSIAQNASPSFEKNIQNTPNIIDQDLQGLEQKQLQSPSPPLNNNLLLAPQLQQKRCSSMETDVVFKQKELLLSKTTERKPSNNYSHIGPNNSHEESDSQSKQTNLNAKKREANYSEEKAPKSQIVYSQTFKNSGKQQQSQISHIQRNQEQQQQSLLQRQSPTQGQLKSLEGFIQKNCIITNQPQATNKQSSAQQFLDNQNSHLSLEAQALKQVYKQQSLVKQKNLIAKLINQQHFPLQKSQSQQEILPKQLLKQESVPNLQITTTSIHEEPQSFPTKYYLGSNQQRSSSTGQIVTSSFSQQSMKSSSNKKSEHKKTGSMIDLSVGDALTNIVLAQKPVRVVASSSSKRIRDSQGQSPSSKQTHQPQRKSFEITFLNSEQQISTKPQQLSQPDRSDSFQNLMNKVKNEQKTIDSLEPSQSSQKMKYQSFLKNPNSSSQIKKSKWLSENTACFYNLGGCVVSPEKPALSERLDQNTSCQISIKNHQNTNISSIVSPGIQWNALNNSEDTSAVGNTYYHMRSGSKNQIALANYCQNSMGTHNGLPRIVANQTSGNKANFRNNFSVTERLNQNSMSQYMQSSQQQIQNSTQMSYLDHMNCSSAMKQLQQQSTSGIRILSPEKTTTTSRENNNRKSISILKSPKPLQTVLSKLIFPERERATASHLASCISYRTPRQTYLNTQ